MEVSISDNFFQLIFFNKPFLGNRFQELYKRLEMHKYAFKELFNPGLKIVQKINATKLASAIIEISWHRGEKTCFSFKQIFVSAFTKFGKIN